MQEQPMYHHDTDICGSLWMDIQLVQPPDFNLSGWSMGKVAACDGPQCWWIDRGGSHKEQLASIAGAFPVP